MSQYEDECTCCGEEVIIRGAYIGHYSDVYCTDCGFEAEFCGGTVPCTFEEDE